MGAYVNLGSFYLLGIPMAMLLGFVLKMGENGLWMGVVCGSISQTTLLSAITFFTDWQKMVCSSEPTVTPIKIIRENEQSKELFRSVAQSYGLSHFLHYHAG